MPTDLPITSEIRADLRTRPNRYPPTGWFVVAYSHDLPPRAVLPVHALGQELVVYRTGSGHVRIADAHCPHLGAHLGVGGTVHGDNLVCPFHGLSFDPDGHCARTATQNRAPRLALTNHLVREVDGVIALWHGNDVDATPWELPSRARAVSVRTQRFTAHITGRCHDIAENAIDTAHIPALHGYHGFQVIEAMEADGPIMTIHSRAERRLLGRRLPVEFAVTCYGLGYLWVDATLPTLNARAEFQMMPTPINDRELEIRFAFRIINLSNSKEPRVLTSDILTRLAKPLFWRDIRRDFPIWSNKTHIDRPSLTASDGPIMPFRRWAAQFDEQSS